MAKTKKQKAQDDALAWLTMQGNKAMQNQNAKELKVIQYLITELKKPDYEVALNKLAKHIRVEGNISFSTFKELAPLEKKPKTINQKANKRI